MIGFTVNTDRAWVAPERPKDGTELLVDAYSSPYSDDVKLQFGDAFNVMLTPQQAIDLGQGLLAVGAYHRVFKARFGVADRDAIVSRRPGFSGAGSKL